MYEIDIEIVIEMLIRLLLTYVCYRIAKRKNRDEILAAIFGFCFPFISAIIYSLLSNKRPKN